MGDDSIRSKSTGPTSTTPPPDTTAGPARAPNTLLNALIGGVVGVVFSFIPFSTVVGGGVAGYLEGGDRRSGAKVGALAGLVAFVPLLLVGLAVLLFIPVMSTTGSGLGLQLALFVSLFFVVLLIAIYTVGLSALGGVLGVYVKNEL